MAEQRRPLPFPEPPDPPEIPFAQLAEDVPPSDPIGAEIKFLEAVARPDVAAENIAAEVADLAKVAREAAIAGPRTHFPKLEEVKERSRKRLLARSVGQEDLGTFKLPTGLRIKMSFAKSLRRKHSAFKNAFPDGELAVVNPTRDQPGGLLFRPDRKSDFSLVDPDDFEMADVFEFFAENAGALVGELALTFAVPEAQAVRGAARFLRPRQKGIIARGGAGAFTGSVTQDSMSAFAFGEGDPELVDDSLTEILARGGVEAVASVIGGKAFDIFGRMTGGVGVVEISKGGTESRAAAKRLTEATGKEVSELPLHLETLNQFVKRLGGQSEMAGFSGLKEYIRQHAIATTDALRTFAKDMRGGKLPDLSVLERTEAAEQRRILTDLYNTVDINSTELRRGGQAIIEGIDETQRRLDPQFRQDVKEKGFTQALKSAPKVTVQRAGRNRQKLANWDVSSRGRITLAYAKATELETPTLTKTKLHSQTAFEVDNLARNIKSDVAGRGQLVDLAERLRRWNPSDAEIYVARDELPDGTFQEYVQEFNSFDIMRRIRSDAFELMNSAPLGMPDTVVQEQARRIYGAANNILQNPTFDNANAARAWKRADRLYQTNAATRQAAHIVKALKAADNDGVNKIATMYSDISDPEMADMYRALKRALPERKWNQFKDAAFTRLANHPFEITTMLERAGILDATTGRRIMRAPATGPASGIRQRPIDALLGEREISALIKAGREADKLGQVGFRNLLREQTRVGALVGSLVDGGSTARLDALHQVMMQNGGHDGPMGSLIGAGIFDDIAGAGVGANGEQVLGKAIDMTPEGPTINANRLRSLLARYEEVGALKFLKPDEIQILRDAELLSQMVKASSDAGTSIAGAEVASQVRGLLFGSEGSSGGFKTLIENITVGMVFKNKQLKRLLGSGRKQTRMAAALPYVTALGGALGILAANAEGMIEAGRSVRSMLGDVGTVIRSEAENIRRNPPQ